MSKQPKLFRINYINQQQVYEIYARQISTDQLLGFMSITDIQFDHRDALVIDPVEEQLKSEFKDVEVLHVPIQQIIKVEQVSQKKSCKISALKTDNVITPMRKQPGPQS
ncbi:DUF1820 family protein [Marinicella sediminis]|uniref:DUF1820 family protein n=1 Tax=Marinicella sediminis TaxID=1792834 RepID=A0ABV7J4F2_9GAMM|nr:DUF1820 family protein [Marinicella sediminis]